MGKHWISTSNPSLIESGKQKANQHMSPIWAQVSTGQPRWAARKHILRRSQLTRNGHSDKWLSFLHPPVPLKWHNRTLVFPIEDFPFKNKQAEVSLICFLFNSGRR